MDSAERKALILLFSLGVVGQGVRWLATRPGEPPGEVQLLDVLPPRSPLPHRDSAIALARPLGPGERIDVDQAGPEELARLPRVGLALAKTIVADRQANGAFGALTALDRVPGVGPGLLRVIGPHLSFSGTPAPPPVPIPALPARSLLGSTGPPTPGVRLDLNVAGVAELDALPGIGPARARAILRYREEHGRFAAVEDLARIPGFGPAALARLRDRVEVR
jgi:competence ComEA-like helix-hairpin-helix protein